MGKETRKDIELSRSLVTSLCVCVPSLCLSWYLMETHLSFTRPARVMMGILCIGVLNFALIMGLEHCRTRIGRFTLPALLGATAVVLLYVIAESLNRFVGEVGYLWLLPAVMLCLGLSSLAIFKETRLPLKLQLAFNSLVVALLWALGASDRVALPF